MATLLRYSCVKYTFPTYLFTETTQIWGKEFPGSMFSMMPGNSSFFVFSRLTMKNASALDLFSPPKRPTMHQSTQSRRSALERAQAARPGPVL